MSFINFNNKSELYEGKYSARVIAEALYSVETKNTKKIEATLSSVKEPVAISEALKFFSNKINAISALQVAKTNALPVNEGQFSWMTQDTGEQIGSERENRITVFMYDNEGNQWKEDKYDGYGEFGGMDYYELLAKMNGYSEEDLEDVKGPFKEMRQLGIDLAFGKLKTKDKGRKVLFPALVTDPRYNWKKHNFTQEPESDPNQSWYVEPDYDDDEYYEAKTNEEDLNERSINKIQKEWAKVTADMKATVVAWKEAEGEEKNKMLAKLKELTAKKKKLEVELDAAIGLKDADVELVGEATMQEIDKKVQKFVIKNANDYDYSNQDSAFQIYLSLKKLYPSLIKESAVTEGEKTQTLEVVYQGPIKKYRGGLYKARKEDDGTYTVFLDEPGRQIVEVPAGDVRLVESAVTEYRDDKWKVVDSNGNEVAGPDAKHIMVDYAKQKRGWKAIKVKESAVTEEEDYSDEMSYGQLESCIDNSTMIRDRIKQGVSLDPWMHSQIAVAKNELTSVFDALDGDDGVVEKLELTEGVMSNLHQMAGSVKDEEEFVKKFFKEYGAKVKKNAESTEWVKSLYKDTVKESIDEAVTNVKVGDLVAHDKTGERYKVISKPSKTKIIGKNKKGEEKTLSTHHITMVDVEIHEAKTLDRDEMMVWLEDHLNVVRTSEEFDGAQGGIWTSGEEGDMYKGKRIYDYYTQDAKKYSLGVLDKWEKELNKRGWYSEWYDAGTVMIWEM